MFPRLFVRNAAVSSRSFKAVTRNMSLAVRLHKAGPAHEAYKLETVEVDKSPLKPQEVAVKFLAAPINPADINIAEGVYGKQPPLPAVGGNEGVAVVTQVGSGVTRLSVGDWVLPTVSPFGTWRQEARAAETSWLRVRNDIPAEYAATMSVNMATAYRLLNDFGNLKPGDWIIQNGANSMVGMAVIQLARERGIRTINIIREDRPDVHITQSVLTNLGGDICIPDSYLPRWQMQEILAELPPIQLALNCVGGEVATNMVRVLGEGGTMVTYGGMSKQPLSLPTEVVAQKKLTLTGFWMTKWYETATLEARQQLFDTLGELIKDQKLTFFYESHDLDDFSYALEKSTEPYRFRKVVLKCDFPDRMAEHDALSEDAYNFFNDPQF